LGRDRLEHGLQLAMKGYLAADVCIGIGMDTFDHIGDLAHIRNQRVVVQLIRSDDGWPGQ